MTFSLEFTVLGNARQHEVHAVHDYADHQGPEPDVLEELPGVAQGGPEQCEKQGVHHKGLYQTDHCEGQDVSPLAVEGLRRLDLHDRSL